MCLSTETVKSAARALEGVHDVESSNGFARDRMSCMVTLRMRERCNTA